MRPPAAQVPVAHITRLDIIPDIDNSRFTITVHGSPASAGLAVRVSLTDHPDIHQVRSRCTCYFTCCLLHALA